jgi:hypothetical protein
MKLSILAILSLAVLQVSGNPHKHVLEPREPQCLAVGGMLHRESALA